MKIGDIRIREVLKPYKDLLLIGGRSLDVTTLKLLNVC